MALDRKTVLEGLLALDKPVEEILSALRAYDWDSEVELVRLAPVDITAVLGRFLSGTLSAKDVEDWAEAIEGRDDIDYASPESVPLAVHELANPLITQPLTRQSAEYWIAQLSV